MKVTAAACSHKGLIRANNEDNFYLGGTYMPKKDMDVGGIFNMQGEKSHVFAVCDGMGGEDAGEDASFAAVSMLPEMEAAIQSDEDINRAIRIYAQQANNAILQMRNEGKLAGTTLALVCIHDGSAIVAHLGDSRAYLFRNKILSQLTRDHTEVQRQLNMGIISHEEAKTHPKRNAITAFLGADDSGMSLTPEFSKQIRMLDGDRFLLCSDGLTDMVEDEQIAHYMDTGDPQDVVKALVDEALLRGGKDNVTALVLELSDLESDNKGNEEGWLFAKEAAQGGKSRLLAKLFGKR